MATDDVNSLLNAGIQAAKAGRRAEARRLIEQVLEKDDNNEQAWMWFASVVDTPRERRICLENVLEINPNNENARKALEKLGSASDTGGSSASSSRILDPNRTQVRSGKTPIIEPKARPRKRRINPLILFGGGAIALALIIGGLVLLLNPEQVPGVVVPTAVVAQPTSTRPGPTGTPVPTIDPTLLAGGTAGPTWTPRPTSTDRPTSTPTPTLPPLSSYMLIYVGEGRDARKAASGFLTSGDFKDETIIAGAQEEVVTDVAIYNNQALAYTAMVGDRGQLYVANGQGGNAKQLTKQDATIVRSPAWSADGKKLAYVSNETGNSEIYTINADGTEKTQITNNKVEDRDPAWSPDGSKLAFASDPTGKKSLQIFVLDLRTNKTTQLTTSTNDNYSPAWSADSKMIAFVSTRDRFQDIYTMNADGSRQMLITYGDGEAANRDPSWSPDGKFVAFASNRDGGIFNLFMVSPDGKVVRQITKLKVSSYGVRFRTQ